MKVVYGNMYFALEAIDEVPDQARQAYKKAVKRLSADFRHNLVKVAKDYQSVTLLWYPHLETCAHPYLQDSLLVPLKKSLPTRYREASKSNPVILHRLETMLAMNNPRRTWLAQLTSKEEQAGLYSKKHARLIGRREYWNELCQRLGMLESLAPTNNPTYVQLELFSDIQTTVSIKREATAMARTRPSAPTRWAFENGFVVPIVLDWGCGKGRDSEWLQSLGIDVVSYDPFYRPHPSPDELDFAEINAVILNYVLNVIENISERQEVLERIHVLSKPNTIVVISARSSQEIERQASKGKWRELHDGYVTSRSTFQKGFTMDELISFCSVIGRVVETTSFHGGVTCVISTTK